MQFNRAWEIYRWGQNSMKNNTKDANFNIIQHTHTPAKTWSCEYEILRVHIRWRRAFNTSQNWPNEDVEWALHNTQINQLDHDFGEMISQMKFVWLHCHHVHNSHAIKYLIKQRLGQSLSIKSRWTHYRFPKMKWLNSIRWINSVTHSNYRRLIKPFIVSQLLSHHSCHDNWNAQLIQSHTIVSALHRDVETWCLCKWKAICGNFPLDAKSIEPNCVRVN